MAKRSISTEIKLDGEQAYKKAMSEINSGLKVLGSEIKLTAAQFKGQANSLAALTDKHDILSRSILTQKDKVEEAKRALQESAQAYGESDKRTQAWQVTLNNAERELIGMYEELGKTEKYMDEASKSTDKCAKSIDEYGREVEQAEKKTSRFGEIFKAAFWANLASQAFTAITGKIKEFASASIEAADKYGTMAEIYGLTSDRIQELEFAGIRLDVSLETMTGSMTKLVRNMNSARAGSKLQEEAFKKLGIEITNTDGSLRNANTVFGEAIDALGKESAYDTDKLSKMAEQEFKLWSLQNQSASDGEKLAKQAELLALKYEMQGENVSEAEAALADMVKQYGANSAESVKLQEQLLKEKIAYMELKAQIDEVNRARGYVGGSNIGASGFMQAANIWAGLNNQKINTDISGMNGLTRQDVGGMIAGAVNAMGTMASGSNGRTIIELRNIVNGKEFSRAIIEDLRAVDASSPKVVSDRI